MTIYNNKKNSYTVMFCGLQQLSAAVTDDYVYCDLLFEIFECLVAFSFIFQCYGCSKLVSDSNDTTNSSRLSSEVKQRDDKITLT